jgi:hypothetical protein
LKGESATAGEIYQAVSGALGDTISRPAYYKLLNRLVAAGQIEQLNGSGPQRYVVAPQLHAANRLTLDDVYELLPFVQSTEAMARAYEAQRYFFENRDKAIRRAAEALTRESAPDLFCRWILDLITMLLADLESYRLVETDGSHIGKAVLADEPLEHRLRMQCDQLRDILYRQLSVSRKAVDVPDWDGPRGLKHGGRLRCDSEALRTLLEMRVIGVGNQGTVIGLVAIEQPILAAAEQDLIVSGSDGSFHAGTLGIQQAQGYVEDESFIVTINNGAAFVRSSDRLKAQRGLKEFLHSAPVTRATLDDPTYKGMVLAPFMFPTLTESEYEHMTRAASDVVQMRVDEEVFTGTARDLATGEQIVTPRVHIRDGTITPQERGFNHYCSMNPYGDIAREGITRSRNILQRIVGARGSPQAYVGSVKSTQIRLFSRLLNWYIMKGSRETLGEAIDPTWDLSRAGYISDINAMTELLATRPPRRERDGFWTSCVVIRQFASLTEFFELEIGDGNSWLHYLRERRAAALRDYEQYRGPLPYHAMISEDDLAEDSYLYMLDRADYASFYVGHTASNQPVPKIPRYEFLCSLREMDVERAREHVGRTVEQVTTALLVCGFTPDRDHNFLSQTSLVRLVPSVVYRAHEFAKHLGKRLEHDYKSAVVARLAARRNQPINERDVEIRPIGVRKYLQRFINARRELPSGEHDGTDR